MRPETVEKGDLPERSQKGAELRLTIGLVAFGILSASAVAWQWTPLREWVDLEQLLAELRALGHSPVAVVIIIAAYPIGGLVMLPTIPLILLTVAMFGPLLGLIYAMLGCLVSASGSYALGQALGQQTLARLAGRHLDRVTQLLAGREVLAVAAVNWSQIVSLTLIGFAAGTLRIGFPHYILGTLIGTAPGILLLTLFENQLERAILDPSLANIAALAVIGAFMLVAAFWSIRRLTSRLRSVGPSHRRGDALRRSST